MNVLEAGHDAVHGRGAAGHPRGWHGSWPWM